MIRESCRTSPTLDQLSADAERLFFRLTTVADDFGRFEADPRVLLASCFPLKVGVLKVEAVARWFRELTACSLVRTYVSGCKQLAFFVTWEKHQYTRAKTSKYPAPPSVGTCEQMPTDSPVVTGSTVGTEEHGSTEHHEVGVNGSGPVSGFDEFWQAYPKKKAKDDAKRAWLKLEPDGPLRAVILAALAAQRRGVDWARDNGQYIPYPASWLNGKRWTDEVEAAQPFDATTAANIRAGQAVLDRLKGQRA